MGYIILLILSFVCFFVPKVAQGTDYHVGPNQPIVTLSGVQWSALKGGDNVYIHYSVYHEKFNISSRGSEDKPIKVIGVPDEYGKRPTIDGKNAMTPLSSDFRWKEPSLIQRLGVVFITPSNSSLHLPGYIEIKNLEIRNGNKSFSFFSENGELQAYDKFSAGIYIRSSENVLIENCLIHDNGQAIFSWSGYGQNWWDGVNKNLTIRGNHFFKNGNSASYYEHQTYTEGQNITIEHNRYGPLNLGSLGSHLKDRSAGTIIRYNYFETAPTGWVIDLVEPESSWCATGFGRSIYNSCPVDPKNFKYLQSFVYGNIIINKVNPHPNYFHWNEDHQTGSGRAVEKFSRLFFYNNTILTILDNSEVKEVFLFNTTWGGYECFPGLLNGMIDIRNNIFALIPKTKNKKTPTQYFSYCKNTNFKFGVNWISPRWKINSNSIVTGEGNIITGIGNNPGFKNIQSGDLHLIKLSEVLNKGKDLATEVENNYLGDDLSPKYEFSTDNKVFIRTKNMDLGAYEFKYKSIN